MGFSWRGAGATFFRELVLQRTDSDGSDYLGNGGGKFPYGGLPFRGFLQLRMKVLGGIIGVPLCLANGHMNPRVPRALN